MQLLQSIERGDVLGLAGKSLALNGCVLAILCRHMLKPTKSASLELLHLIVVQLKHTLTPHVDSDLLDSSLGENAEPVLFAALPVASVLLVFFEPLVGAVALTVALDVVARVAADLVREAAHTMHLAVLPLTLVEATILPGVVAKPMQHVVH